MKKIFLTIVALMVLVGCSTTTHVFKGEEKVWTVESKADAMVSVKDGDQELVVDNRGAPSAIDRIVDIMTLGLLSKE